MAEDGDAMPDDEEGSDEPKVTLGWKDYLALFIAFIETIALPLVIMLVIVLVMLALIR